MILYRFYKVLLLEGHVSGIVLVAIEIMDPCF